LIAKAAATRTPVMKSVAQPPSKNFTAVSETRMDAVSTKPNPLTASFCLQVLSVARICHQWRTIPSWESEKVMNTLIE
jgi:hypothetical protein